MGPEYWGPYTPASLPESNMETQKGLYKDYSPKGGYMGFHVSFGECMCPIRLYEPKVRHKLRTQETGRDPYQGPLVRTLYPKP